MATSRLEIAPERFPAWWQQLLAGPVEPVVASIGDTVTARWADREVTARSFRHHRIGIVLIRRGGYAVGLADSGRLTASKVGRRHVQGRTAAGGWSQQRFARRREGQAAVLVEAVAGHARDLLAQPDGIPDALVVGGDRGLWEDVLSDPRLSALASLPRRELPDLPDPDRSVLSRAVWRGRAVWVTGDVDPAAAGE